MKTQPILVALSIGILLAACQPKQEPVAAQENDWNMEALREKAAHNLDSNKWDTALLKQDIETYNQFAEVFQSYPLNKSPFPVAEYDYAVSSIPFTIEANGKIFKGYTIGEYENMDSDSTIQKLTLLVLTNDPESEETALVESRNAPYLTAEGYFKVANQVYEWVFAASPDGFSTLMVNMKLFDLRFGETIIIYPQVDHSFLYDQIVDSPNNYPSIEEFKTAILNSQRVQNQIISERN